MVIKVDSKQGKLGYCGNDATGKESSTKANYFQLVYQRFGKDTVDQKSNKSTYQIAI